MIEALKFDHFSDLDLSGYFFSSLRSSSCKSLSTTFFFHPRSKAMSPFSYDSAWLVCSFHKIYLVLVKIF